MQYITLKFQTQLLLSEVYKNIHLHLGSSNKYKLSMLNSVYHSLAF